MLKANVSIFKRVFNRSLEKKELIELNKATTRESYTFNVPFTYLKSEMTPSKDLLKLREKMLLTKEDFLRTMDKELNPIQTKIINNLYNSFVQF